MIIFTVIFSPNANAPTRIAVTGSNTPRTEAFVGPIILVAIASIAVEITVGITASPIRLPQTSMLSNPLKRTEETGTPPERPYEVITP